MTSRLRKRERCPIHNSYFCCGRSQPNLSPRRSASFGSKADKQRQPAVARILDPTHPRGYRELCSKQELHARKNRLIADQIEDLRCLYCKELLTDYRDIHLCHREPKGMGGARRDDHMDNLGLGHARCNFQNGSRRIA